MREIKAPNTCRRGSNTTVFLAGSIEMGKAEPWQGKVVQCLKDIPELTVFNPRRDDWDSTWEQTIENKQFYKQVQWEQIYLGEADIKFFYFDPKTKSPITLLELGQTLYDAWICKIIVVCPKGFWRKGNVDIVCKNHNITVYESLGDGVEGLKRELETNDF